jgi:hypothetical protein
MATRGSDVMPVRVMTAPSARTRTAGCSACYHVSRLGGAPLGNVDGEFVFERAEGRI